MALNRLGAVFVNDGTTFSSRGDYSYDDNDQLLVYYDDSADTIRVYKNPGDANDPSGSGGTLVTVGNPVFPADVNVNGVVSIDTTRYSYCESTTLVRYYRNFKQFWHEEFPYFKRETDANSPSCQVSNDPSGTTYCDIVKSGSVNVIDETSDGAGDGSITISVKTTDPSGVEFALETFSYGNGNDGTRGSIDRDDFYPYSYTFSNLSRGTYDVYAKDTRGCEYVFDTITVGLGANYGNRLYFDFDDVSWDDRSHTEYRIIIKQKDYSDASSLIGAMSGSPVEISVGNVGNRGKYNSVYGTQMILNIRNETNNQYSSIFFGDSISDKSFIAELYRDPTGDNELMHRGYFLAEEFQEPYVQAPYDMSLYFVDGLGDLQSEQWDEPFGKASSLEVITKCLRKTGLINNKVRIVSPKYPGNHYDASGNLTADGSTTAFEYMYKDMASYQGLTYQEVLDSVLSATTPVSEIRSYGGNFWIKPIISDASSYNYVQYDINGNYESSGTIDFRKDNGDVDSSGSVIVNQSGNRSRDAVYKKIRVVEDRVIRRSVFNDMSEDNVTGEEIDAEIVGDGFLGYNTIFRGDNGSFQVRKVFETVDRDASKLIERFSRSYLVGIREIGYRDERYGDISFGTERVVKVVNGVRKSNLSSATIQEKSKDYFLTFNIPDGQGGNAVLTSQANIECSKNDSFNFSFNYIIKIEDCIRDSVSASLQYQPSPPLYLKLRYRLYITDSSGETYWLNGQDWDTVAPQVINEYFVDEANYSKISSFSVQGTMPVNDDNCTVIFEIMDLDPYYYDDSGNPSTVFASLDATNIPAGYRYIISKDSNHVLDYYELQDSAEASGNGTYTALNNSDLRWKHISTRTLKPLSESPNCLFSVNNVSFISLPGGQEFDEEAFSDKTGSDDNLYDFEYPVYHFNLKGVQTNERGMILNYWQDSSGSPIVGFGADNQFSQDLILNELVAQYRSPKDKINADFGYFSEINATNTIRITYDSNKLYKFNTFNQDIKNRTISGEIVEIGTDGEVISIGAFSDAFSDAFDN